MTNLYIYIYIYLFSFFIFLYNPTCLVWCFSSSFRKYSSPLARVQRWRSGRWRTSQQCFQPWAFWLLRSPSLSSSGGDASRALCGDGWRLENPIPPVKHNPRNHGGYRGIENIGKIWKTYWDLFGVCLIGGWDSCWGLHPQVVQAEKAAGPVLQMGRLRPRWACSSMTRRQRCPCGPWCLAISEQFATANSGLIHTQFRFDY